MEYINTPRGIATLNDEGKVIELEVGHSVNLRIATAAPVPDKLLFVWFDKDEKPRQTDFRVMSIDDEFVRLDGYTYEFVLGLIQDKELDGYGQMATILHVDGSQYGTKRTLYIDFAEIPFIWPKTDEVFEVEDALALAE